MLTKAGAELNNYGITYDNYLVIDHQGILRYSSADNGGLGERYRINEITSAIEQQLKRIGLNNGGEIPNEFTLSQNFPNPFNVDTMIKYNLPTGGHVSLIVYDIRGRIVASLVDEVQAPSDYEVPWSASRLILTPGIYFYKLKFNGTEITRKMAYIK